MSVSVNQNLQCIAGLLNQNNLLVNRNQQYKDGLNSIINRIIVFLFGHSSQFFDNIVTYDINCDKIKKEFKIVLKNLKQLPASPQDDELFLTTFYLRDRAMCEGNDGLNSFAKEMGKELISELFKHFGLAADDINQKNLYDSSGQLKQKFAKTVESKRTVIAHTIEAIKGAHLAEKERVARRATKVKAIIDKSQTPFS